MSSHRHRKGPREPLTDAQRRHLLIRLSKARQASGMDLYEDPPGSGVFALPKLKQIIDRAQEKTGFKTKYAKKLQQDAADRRAEAAAAEIQRIATMSASQLAGLIGFALGRYLWNRSAQRTYQNDE